MDEFPLDLRDTPWDLANLILVLGTLVLNWITFFVYLIIRSFKKKRDVFGKKKVPSKADRPLYICGLCFAATNWLLGTLFTSGTVTVRMDDRIPYLPAIMIYFVQYLGGALLWLWLTVDRMLARYASVRFAGEHKGRNGIILRFTAALAAFIPFLAVAITIVALDKVEVNSLGVTDQDDTFEIIMVVYHGMLALGVSFLIFKIRKIIGNFHELIRYSIFLAMTLFFFLNDALTTLIHALQTEVIAQQCLMLLVWVITTAGIYWILILAIKPRKDAKVMEEELETNAVVRTKMTDDQAINHFIDEDSCGANDPPENAVFDTTKAILWYGWPRRKLAGPQEPKPFVDFVRQLPDELSQTVDRDSGIFSQTPNQPVKYKSIVGYMAALRA